MNLFEFDLAVATVSVLAGFLGALTGLGGGVVIVPVLSLMFGVDIRYAIGASLVSVIATSSGAASAYVKEGYTNLRIGMFLEIATTLGALLGAFIAAKMSTGVVAIIFGMVLMYSAYLSSRPRREVAGADQAERLAQELELDSSYPGATGPHPYHVHAVPFGFSMMFVAGTISGLLGIGSGAVKVVAMDEVMRVPFKVSTTTSNFMIGVTAAASAGGVLEPRLHRSRFGDAGYARVLASSLAGTRLLVKGKTMWLRRLFAVVIFALAVEMIYNGMSGRL
jgi:uncharacterized membrane protein YfcA